MKFGVVFPQVEIGPDRELVRRYTEATAACGYDYLLAYDHVLGADITNRPDWAGAYEARDSFHEIFVLFGFMAAIAPSLEMTAGVLVLPQRQTALAAKQAAEVDILTGGNFRLGVGVGWNFVEFEALGEEFGNRGKRQVDQIALLRRLWQEPVITFKSEFHTISEAGLNPLPLQRPIPIWIGGSSTIAIDRAAQLADGWFPQGVVDDSMRASLKRLREKTNAAGRDPKSVGIDARIDTKRSGEGNWERNISAWRDAGATHLAVSSMGLGHDINGHIALIERFAKVASGYR